MKALVVYYSRTGHTKKAAETISDRLVCDTEEIIDTVDRSGPRGIICSGRQAMKKELTVIEDMKKDVSSYDIIIVGTPIWVFTMSTPVRTFIREYKDHFKKVAFFCTYGGVGVEKTFTDMGDLCGKNPVGVLALRMLELRKDYTGKVKEFVQSIEPRQ